MDGYTLAKNYFDWAFENSQKVSGNHAALYFYCIDLCNRLGWKKEFGLPTEVTKLSIGVRNPKTYAKILNDLAEWGFLKIIEKSKNQHSATVVALVKNTQATTKAHTSALYRQIPQQGNSTVVIDKQENIKPLNLETLKPDNEKKGDDSFRDNPDCPPELLPKPWAQESLDYQNDYYHMNDVDFYKKYPGGKHPKELKRG